MAESRVWIVRHGNTFDKGDTVTRVGGRTDLPLSQSGKAQADALARHFAGKAFISARTSPLKRTTQTAMTILGRQTAPPMLQTADFLREIDYGPDENRPEADVVERIGEAALDAWETKASPPEGWIVDPESLMAGWQALFAAVSQEPGDHLVVTSNGVARFALFAADRGDQPLKLPTGGYGRIDLLSAGTPRLAEWGERP